MTKTITKGCYVGTSEIKDTEQWKKVIDAFVEAGYTEYEGYSSRTVIDYIEYWRGSHYLGVDADGDIVHFDNLYSFDDTPKKLMLSEVLAVTPSFRIEKNLSDMADQGKIETLQEICSEGWKLGGIEPNGDYIFYRES